MAKKETENLVEEKLKNLYQLQTTLSAIDEKRGRDTGCAGKRGALQETAR